MRTPVKVVLIVVVNVIIFLLLVLAAEGFLAWRYHNPGKDEVTLEAARDFYNGYHAKVIQYLPECAEWNATTLYLLKPGTFRFANLEFDNAYQVNSKGMRDDEASLDAPEIIVCGDSQAMGWGVEQDETFANIIERELGRKTLNAGISSFGTAREMVLLNEQDLSNTKYIVVQYSGNDLQENRKLLGAEGPLKISEKRDYIGARSRMRDNTAYYPGKYLRVFLPMLKDKALELKQEREKRDADPEAYEQGISKRWRGHAWNFLRVLASRHWDLSPYHIIAFKVERNNKNVSTFAEYARAILENPKSDPRIQALNVTMIDMAKVFEDTDYFVHDDHINAAGHRKIADEVLRVIREIEASRP